MSKVTPQQKQALIHLARRYAPAVCEIVERGAVDDISIFTDREAALLDEFAATITSGVVRDYPDYMARDENINADAELAVHMIADLLAEYRQEQAPNSSVSQSGKQS